MHSLERFSHFHCVPKCFWGGMVPLIGIKVCQYKTLTIVNQHLKQGHCSCQKVVLSAVKGSCTKVWGERWEGEELSCVWNLAKVLWAGWWWLLRETAELLLCINEQKLTRDILYGLHNFTKLIFFTCIDPMFYWQFLRAEIHFGPGSEQFKKKMSISLLLTG